MSKNDNIGIIAEPKFSIYTEPKLRNIGIYLFTAKNSEDIQQYRKDNKFKHSIKKFYIVGSHEYCKKMFNQINDIAKSQKAKCIQFSDKSIDEVMKKEGLTFPEVVSEFDKKNKLDKSKSEFDNIIEKFKDSGLTDAEIMGAMMAADELEEMKIFPNTYKNTYDAFIKLASTYILDDERAKIAADIFLEKKR